MAPARGPHPHAAGLSVRRRRALCRFCGAGFDRPALPPGEVAIACPSERCTAEALAYREALEAEPLEPRKPSLASISLENEIQRSAGLKQAEARRGVKLVRSPEYL